LISLKSSLPEMVDFEKVDFGRNFEIKQGRVDVDFTKVDDDIRSYVCDLKT